MARHFRSGVDAMIREAELEELQKKWQAENARIMAEHPMLPDSDTPPPAGEESSLPATEAEPRPQQRSEEHTSELQSLMRISYAVFCLKKKTTPTYQSTTSNNNSTSQIP